MLDVILHFNPRMRNGHFKMVFVHNGKTASYEKDINSAFTIAEIERWNIVKQVID